MGGGQLMISRRNAAARPATSGGSRPGCRPTTVFRPDSERGLAVEYVGPPAVQHEHRTPPYRDRRLMPGDLPHRSPTYVCTGVMGNISDPGNGQGAVRKGGSLRLATSCT